MLGQERCQIIGGQLILRVFDKDQRRAILKRIDCGNLRLAPDDFADKAYGITARQRPHHCAPQQQCQMLQSSAHRSTS